MGGAVSSGRDNDELIDNLMGSNYIRTRAVEQVFRALDRADYMTRDARDQAYKDLAWRSGLLHMSAPCIYSEVMENLELKPGLSFLNVGSGTGYLSTLVGLIIGVHGISHGVELRPSVVEYANKRLSQFMENSPTLDEFDFCEPKFYIGNALCLAPLVTPYDRVYCGAGCPTEYENYFKQLIKVGGILVMPLEDNLVQVKRLSEHEWSSRTVLNVSFATLTVPSKQEAANLVKLDEQTPARLQALSRAAIRAAMRGALRRRHPELRAAPVRAPPAKKACPRRICIPLDDDSDVEGLGVLHDLYRDTGASEMNALLSFMLSMGHNRVAGALRFDTNDTDDSEDEESGDHGDSDNGDDDDGGGSPEVGLEGFPRPDSPRPFSPSNQDPADDSDDRPRRCGLITLDFRDITVDSGTARTEAETARTDGETARTDGETARTDTETASNEQSSGKEGENAQSKVDKDDSNKNAQLDAGDGQGPSSSSGKKSDNTRKSRKGSGDSRSEDKRRRSAEDTSFWESVAGECSRAEPTQGDGDVPAEVEIYLGKTRTSEAGASKWSMEWEEGGTAPASSDESPRLKDSGLGDDSLSDEVEERAERPRLVPRARASSDSSSRSASPDARQRRRNKRRAAEGGDARRVRLSLLMKQGIKELPLPAALKKREMTVM